jgi:hypothetical protein
MRSMAFLSAIVATGSKPWARAAASWSSVTQALTSAPPSAVGCVAWSMLRPSASKSSIVMPRGTLNWTCAGSSGPALATLGASSATAATATAHTHGLIDAPSVDSGREDSHASRHGLARAVALVSFNG